MTELARRLAVTPPKQAGEGEILLVQAAAAVGLTSTGPAGGPAAAFAGALASAPLGTERYRQDVAHALNSLLAKDEATRTTAARALVPWGTTENVPGLITQLSGPTIVRDRGPAMEALGRIKDPKGLAAVASRLPDHWDQGKVVEVLKAAGPAAEAAVFPYVQSQDRKDHFTRIEACKLLAAIGTEKSIPVLEEARKSQDHFVQREAEAAVKAIKARIQ